MSREFPAINPVEIHYRMDAKYPPEPGKYEGDIGLDIAADIGAVMTLPPHQGCWLPGGYSVQFTRGWAGMVLPRSSSNRRRLHVCPAVIDNGYTGNIGAQVINHSREDIVIEPGDRIAQLVLIPAFRPVPVEVAKFEPTDRGSNGWGSSG